MMSRLVVMAGLAGAVIALVVFALPNRDLPDTVLFSNLTQDDSGRIAERLRAANVPFDVGPDGNTVILHKRADGSFGQATHSALSAH